MSGKGANNAPSDRQMRTMGGPWQPLQAPYQKLINQIGKSSKEPWQYGPGVVQGFDPTTSQALAQGTNTALTNDPAFWGATDFAGRAAGGEFVGGTPGMAGLGQTAESGIDNPAYASMLENLRLANEGSGGLDYARKTAAGEFLGKNPYIDEVVNNATADANRTLLPALEGRMAMSGRMGSNAETMGQGEIAKRLGEVASGIRYQDYGAERDRQQAAGLSLPSLLGTELGTRGAAAGAVSDEAYNQDAIKRGATGQYAGIRGDQIGQALGAGGQLGQNFQNQFLGIDRAIGYGGMRQGQAEREAQEAQDRFRFGQSGRYDAINRALGQYGQIAGTTNPALANQAYAGSLNRPSSFQQTTGNLLGLAGGAASIGSMFFKPDTIAGRVLGEVGNQYGARQQ